MIRRSRLAALVLAGLSIVASVAAPAAAQAADPSPLVPVGPNQYFAGVINGTAYSATIYMACYGPTYPGQTGHPIAGQAIKIQRAYPPAPTGGLGYTGSAATAIGATFGPSSTTSAIIFRYYEVTQSIPTSLTLPCWGSGTVSFVPAPTSSTAYPATVDVRFVGQP